MKTATIIGMLLVLSWTSALAAVRPVRDPAMGLEGRWSPKDERTIISHLIHAFKNDKRLKEFDRVLVWTVHDTSGDPIDTELLRGHIQTALSQSVKNKRFMLKGLANLILTANIEVQLKRVDSVVQKKYIIWLRAKRTALPTRQVWSERILIHRTIQIAQSNIGSY